MIARSALTQATAVGVVAAALVAGALPTPGGRVPLGWCSAPAGAAAGLLLFAALARRPPRLPALRPGRGRVLAVAGAYLVLRSTYEEALWRGVVLGLLLAAADPVAALALSLAPWSLAHWRRQRQAAAAHLATGAAFGGLYWASGSLLTPIAAHASYNLAVCLGLERAHAAATRA